MIKNLSNTQFDPGLVAVFVEHDQEFERAGAG
jgi:response regulator RpfG family c-di-GMP phosphodiesterase